MATTLPRESVQDYPRPPSLEEVSVRLRVVFGGEEIAATSRGYRILETHHAPAYYFPPEDVRADVLSPAAGATFCEWKGRARYFDVSVGSKTARGAAWSYPRPERAYYAPIANYLAFYAGLMDAAYVGDIEVIAQPGSFYGGWVTPNLDGIVKGAPGTEHW